MKTKSFIFALFAAGALASLLNPGAALAGEKKTQAELQANAKISKETAQKTALAAVPKATVKEGELEEENGKLIWSFDLTTPGTKNITEVGVDAVTGKIIENKTETAKDEAKEAKEDKEKEAGEKKEHNK